VAYDHSQSAHAPSDAQKNSDITKAEIEAKLTGEITSHKHLGSDIIIAYDNGNGNTTELLNEFGGKITNTFITHASMIRGKAPKHQSGTTAPTAFVGEGVLFGVHS